jgi:tetratricopeptide (TPR) repeat protein
MLVWLIALALNAGAQPGPSDLPRLDLVNYLPAIRVQIEQAEMAARANPGDSKAVARLAMTLHAYQQYDAAAGAYARALSLDPRNFELAYLLGAVRKAQGAFRDAVQLFRSALRIRPGYLPAQLRLAESLAAMADWDNAAASYRDILATHADSPLAWYGLGRVQTAKREHEHALESYERACALFPQYGAAHFALAAELRRLGRQAEAQQQMSLHLANATLEPPLDDPPFERIHELNHSTTARLERAREFEKVGHFAEAIREHESALVTDPDNVQVHINLISLYGRIGDSAKATHHFEIAKRLSPGRSDAWYTYGVLLFRDQKYAEAEAAYRRALSINPQYAEAYNNLGVVEEQRGSFNEATQHFRDAISARPDYPLARFHLGRLLVNQQKYQEAILQFVRCVERDSEQAPACLYALGATYARVGDRTRALEYLDKARSAAIAYGDSRLQTGIERDLSALQAKK